MAPENSEQIRTVYYQFKRDSCVCKIRYLHRFLILILDIHIYITLLHVYVILYSYTLSLIPSQTFGYHLANSPPTPFPYAKLMICPATR